MYGRWLPNNGPDTVCLDDAPDKEGDACDRHDGRFHREQMAAELIQWVAFEGLGIALTSGESGTIWQGGR